MQQLTIPQTRHRVDAYWRDAEGERWATTDRGWVYDEEHPDRDYYDGNAPIGNYLDYEDNRPGGSVHACRTPWSVDPVTRTRVYRPTVAAHFATVDAAVGWIIAGNQ